MTDPVSDFLTRLRNASKAGLAQCVSPHSKFKESLAAILKAEGYVTDYAQGADENGHKTLVVTLKYVDNAPALTHISRISTPGRRLHCGYNNIPRVLNGLGISIVSTSKGLKKDLDCRREKVGGELVCKVW
ncbi:30S ribosomal protein S8 [Opitutaceae bacterium TAV4]|uniref:30S ribosomal protein S8 n=1 Tax=Geminisphaera colitermitum TaxID=1148786 RepID=UPI000158D2F0|nr:30S ribosomal protein S8 [Geminisphaera colitermitum]RRJ96081.1 30S ribosomal protein S8 [Opitutaceae bacterium TAV4]RRK00218.1 30S ribosomal protein S8 [Opitutaceae bacterium TAV3]